MPFQIILYLERAAVELIFMYNWLILLGPCLNMFRLLIFVLGQFQLNLGHLYKIPCLAKASAGRTGMRSALWVCI